MEEIVIVQHCQAKHHIDRSVKDNPDRFNGLTDKGQEQAKLVAERLKRAFESRKGIALCSSDLQRAKETAEEISKATGLGIRFDSGLREWNGDLEIHGERDCKRSDLAKHSLFDWAPFLEGVTWREFYDRVSSCMARLVDECGVDNAIIVTHGGTLSNIVAWWLGLPIDALSERNPFSGKPGSISVLVRNKYGNSIVSKLNDTFHLDRDGMVV